METIEPAAPHSVKDIGDAIVVEEELRDANTSESKRRKIRRLRVVVESGVRMCRVRCRVMMGAGPSDG